MSVWRSIIFSQWFPWYQMSSVYVKSKCPGEVYDLMSKTSLANNCTTVCWKLSCSSLFLGHTSCHRSVTLLTHRNESSGYGISYYDINTFQNDWHTCTIPTHRRDVIEGWAVCWIHCRQSLIIHTKDIIEHTVISPISVLTESSANALLFSEQFIQWQRANKSETGEVYFRSLCWSGFMICLLLYFVLLILKLLLSFPDFKDMDRPYCCFELEVAYTNLYNEVLRYTIWSQTHQNHEILIIKIYLKIGLTLYSYLDILESLCT